MGVRPAQPTGQRNPVRIGDQVPLGARFAAIRGVGADRLAPLCVGSFALSRRARSHAMHPAWPRRSSRVCCNRSQTPAACQSRSRRQQVTPDPQPISCGSSSHASPALRTKMIPVKQARSGTRGRPPFGFGGSGGSRGATSAQRSSVTNGLLRRRHLLLPSPHHPCQF